MSSKIPKPSSMHSSWLPPGNIKKAESTMKLKHNANSNEEKKSVEVEQKRGNLEMRSTDYTDRSFQSMRHSKMLQESKLRKQQPRKVVTPVPPELPSKLPLVTVLWKKTL